MVNLQLLKQKNQSIYLINYIFALIPISIIIGNFAVNLNILLLFLAFIVNFFFFNKKIVFKITLIDKLIFLFFFYSLLVLLINFFVNQFDYSAKHEIIFNKTLLFQRYLILYFLVRVLFEKKILQINFFILTSAFCAIFISLDIIIQFIFGKDIFGIISPSARHYSAIFGEELIAGGYLQKFGLFVLLFWSLLKIKNKIINKYSLIFLFLLISIGIILSGNRMPLFLFLLSFFIYSYFDNDLKKYLKKILITLLLFFFILFYNIQDIRKHFNDFYKSGIFLIETSLFKDLSTEPIETFKKPYVSEFYCSKIFIKQNPIFGGGIRSYRALREGCYTHSHNYYLEILVDLGLIGLAFISSVLIFLSKKFIANVRNKQYLPKESIPFFAVLISEFFPFRTSGSFFSTGNAVVIFVFLSIFVSYISVNKHK